MTKVETSDIPKELLAQAAVWHARISGGEISEADWHTFSEWLEAAEMHSIAFERVEDLAFLYEEEADAIMHEPSVPASNVIQAAAWWARPKVWAGAITAIAATLLIAINLGNKSLPPEIFETGATEMRLVTLQDGSTVHLNRSSRLVVAFNDDIRQSTLTQGEALFSVAKNKERPFRVQLGDRTVQVVGTRFNIVRHKGQVVVTVAEGLVDVAPEFVLDQTEDTASKERLGIGDQLVHQEGLPATLVRKVDARMTTSWQHGYLEYERAALADIATDLGRYLGSPVVVEEDASDISFSGIISISNRETLLAALEQLLPITVHSEGETIFIQRKE